MFFITDKERNELFLRVEELEATANCLREGIREFLYMHRQLQSMAEDLEFGIENLRDVYRLKEAVNTLRR